VTKSNILDTLTARVLSSIVPAIPTGTHKRLELKSHWSHNFGAVLFPIFLGMAGLISSAPLSMAHPSAQHPPVALLRVNAAAVPALGGGYRWRLSTIPADTDILVTDWKIKKLLTDNLAYLRGHNGSGYYDNVDHFQDAILMDAVPPMHFRLLPLQPPTSAHAVLTAPLMGTFAPSPPQAPHPLRIDVTVQGSTAINQHPVTTTIGALQSHGIPVAGTLSAADRATLVRIYGDTGPATDSTKWFTTNEHKLAYQTAARAFVIAQQSHLSLQDPLDRAPSGQDLPSRTVHDQLTGYVVKTFSILGSWNPTPPGDGVLVYWQSSLCIIQVPLLAVGNVSFQISGLHAGKDFTWGDFKNTNWYAANPVGFEANRKKVEAKMTQSLQPAFRNLSHTLVDKHSFLEQEDAINTIIERKGLTESATIATNGVNDLAVLAILDPTLNNISIGGGYSNDKLLFGSLNASFTKKGMTGEITAEAGQRKQDGTLSFSLPDYLPTKDDQWSAGLGVTGNLSRATGLQLNQPDEPATDTDNATAEILHTLKFTSLHAGGQDATGASNDATSNDIYQAALQTAVGYSYVTWDQHDAGAPQLQSGGFWYLRADLNQEWVHTWSPPDQPGLGSLDLLVDTNIKRGFNAGPGDFDFTKLAASTSATFYFGWVTSSDYFLRAVAGGGAMSGKAPVTEEFGLGGNDIVHGLDQDERTARGLLWQSVELGVTLESIFRLLPLPPVASSPSPPANSPASGKTPASDQTQNLLRSTYVSGFAEFAEITQTSVSQTQHLSSDLQSYGVALDVTLGSGKLAARRNGASTQLRLGYAWSPQSIHRSGLFFTDVSIPIF
jgi:hypothetical protein